MFEKESLFLKVVDIDNCTFNLMRAFVAYVGATLDRLTATNLTHFNPQIVTNKFKTDRTERALPFLHNKSFSCRRRGAGKIK